MVDRAVDAYGRIEYEVASVFQMMLEGTDVTGVYVKESADLDLYNALCFAWDKPHVARHSAPPLDHTPEQEHAERQQRWSIPEQFRQIDVREYVLMLCDTEAERARVEDEMALYERHEWLPVLHLMIYLIDYFRTNRIVWGVGRGSSVASFVLFKLGVHKVDSLKYKLDIRDFLKD